QQAGVTPSSVSIPEAGAPSNALADALGVQLPPDFGQVVVYQTKNATKENLLDSAQHALVVLKRGLVVLIVLGVVLSIAAVLVAVDRVRAVFRVGVAITIMSVILIVVARRVAGGVPAGATTRGGKAIAAALADSLKSSLVRVLVILAVLSAVIALCARFLDPILDRIAAHVELARGLSVALGLVVLVVLGLSWAGVITAGVVAAIGLLAVEYAIRRTPPAAPAAPTAPA